MLHQRQSFTCPCCQGFIGEAAAMQFVSDRLSLGHQQTVFEMLSRHMGRPVSKDRLVTALYSDRPDGGPEFADNIVSIEILRLRKAIEAFGWTITSHGRGSGNRAVYRLIPLEAGAC